MRIIGIDFTSVPSRKKPITTVSCTFNNGVLKVKRFTNCENFHSFESILESEGRWVAGLDFPFGQARKLIANLDWPKIWAGYVAKVSEMSKKQFIDTLEAYKEHRKPGDKEHLRQIDKLVRSKSPQKLYGVPVGKMFFEGAPRILNSPVSIQPVRPTDDDRIVIEAYPALVARRWLGKQGYKSDTKSKQTETLLGARRVITEGILSSEQKAIYGFDIDCSRSLSDLASKRESPRASSKKSCSFSWA